MLQPRGIERTGRIAGSVLFCKEDGTHRCKVPHSIFFFRVRGGGDRGGEGGTNGRLALAIARPRLPFDAMDDLTTLSESGVFAETREARRSANATAPRMVSDIETMVFLWM